MKKEIKHCPCCGENLINNQKLAQGIKECKFCKTRFLILITSNEKLNDNKRN